MGCFRSVTIPKDHTKNALKHPRGQYGRSSQLGAMNMEAITGAWTAERIEQLKACLEAGLSCREIALEIGLSRNAVIGKIFRLKHSRGGDQTYSERKGGPKVKRRVTQHRIMMALRAELQSGEEVPLQNGHRCSLLELGKQKCRWPISLPCDVAFWFCGNKAVEGLPYCAGHARIAYRPTSQKTVRL